MANVPKLRVALDISLLGEQFVYGSKTGLYRTTEELLHVLHARSDIALAITGNCGRDPIASSVYCRLYLDQPDRSLEGPNAYFRLLTNSRTGVGNVAEAYYRRSVRRHTRGAGRTLTRRLASGGIARLLALLSRIDTVASGETEDLDVFHSTYFGLPPRSWTRNVPRVITVYDSIPVVAPQFVRPGHASRHRAIVDSIDINRDWVAAISEHAKQEFCDRTKMAPDRVRVTPLAASAHFHPVRDVEQIADARLRYGIPEGDYLLSIASLEPRKNLAHLIRSFFRVCAAEPDLDLNLVLVGSKGWMYEEILSAASSDPVLGSRVVFTGHIPDSDLSTIYSGAAAFVYPSLYEGFGLPPLEAMQCGAPVITSNTTSLPEVVGDAAITVDPSDEDALCDAMLRVLSDADLRDGLRAKGLRRAQDFSWTRCADRTVELYRAAIDHP